MPVISAPDIVVGIAATRAPVTEATALAVSIDAAAAEGDQVAASRPRRAAPPRPPGTLARRHLVHGGGGGGQLTAPRQRPRGREQLEGVEAVLGEQLPAPCPTAVVRKTTVRPASLQTKVAVHCAVAVARVDDRAQVRLDLGAQVLVVGRQRELLAEVLERLVDGEARAQGGDLEEHPARLAEVDRLEVEAVDHRGRLGAGRRSPARATASCSSIVEAQATWWTLPAPCSDRSAGGSS